MTSSSIKKRERRRARYNRNVQKEFDHKVSAWNNGKLIEENHNQNSYSPEYTIAISRRLVDLLVVERNRALKSEQPGEYFINGFRKYKQKIQDTILLWNRSVQINSDYIYLKQLLETYWDQVLGDSNPGALLQLAIDYDK